MLIHISVRRISSVIQSSTLTWYATFVWNTLDEKHVQIGHHSVQWSVEFNHNWVAAWENVPSDMRPTKLQISLRIREVFIVHVKKLNILAI